MVAPRSTDRVPEQLVSQTGARGSALLAPLLLAIALGALAGIGGYAFSYAKGFSYFSTDPRACVNCHIMQNQYDSWQKSSHHTAAVCVDCHLPHEFVPKYIAKAENGWRHGKLFTTGGFIEPIEIKPAGRRILQDNAPEDMSLQGLERRRNRSVLGRGAFPRRQPLFRLRSRRNRSLGAQGAAS